jgi:hypothetical protein
MNSMNKIAVTLLVMPLAGAAAVPQQSLEPQTRVERQMNVTVVREPGDGHVSPLVASTGVDVDFLSMPLGIGGEPVSDAPYSAEAVTEVVQTLADGNRIVRQSKAAVYRDAVGRTRREQGLAVLGPMVGNADGRTSVQIHDPQSGAIYLLDLEKRTAHRLPSPKIVLAQPGATPGELARPIPLPAQDGSLGSVAVGAVAAFSLPVPPPPTGDRQNAVFISRRTITAPMAAQVEPLGTRLIEGVEAEGTRSTTTIPAGQIGNELPIAIVSERWFSAGLHVLMMSRQSDPRFGETTYRLTNVVRSEPAADLFDVPSDFTVIDAPPAGPGMLMRMDKR